MYAIICIETGEYLKRSPEYPSLYTNADIEEYIERKDRKNSFITYKEETKEQCQRCLDIYDPIYILYDNIRISIQEQPDVFEIVEVPDV